MKRNRHWLTLMTVLCRSVKEVWRGRGRLGPCGKVISARGRWGSQTGRAGPQSPSLPALPAFFAAGLAIATCFILLLLFLILGPTIKHLLALIPHIPFNQASL